MDVAVTDLNERIAKVLGWERRKCGALLHWWRPDHRGGAWASLNPWSDSLDLMHELLMKLTGQEFEQYLEALKSIVYPVEMVYAVRDPNIIGIHRRELYEATAAQKAEAWLKVKGG